MTEWVRQFGDAARGMTVSHVWRGHGSALFLELGKLTPHDRRDGSPGAPMGELGVMIEGSWRIEDARTILCGSWSDEDLWSMTLDQIVGREVIDIATFGRLPEITVSLSGERHVASLMTAEGDPGWALFDRRTPRLITTKCRSGIVEAGL